LALLEGGVAEMQTGEGKTLTALLPAYFRALDGRGCHVVTANDYLAQRDAEFARPVFELLGLTVGCVYGELPRGARRFQYACDVTYGTARELGFDFLRDAVDADALASYAQRTHASSERQACRVQRGHFFALVDEADSVLLDDARTPLVLATQKNDDARSQVYAWCGEVAGGLQDSLDFTVDEKALRARLSIHGLQQILRIGEVPRAPGLDRQQLFGCVEHALVARHLLCRDRDYIVGEGGVAIIDQPTGRLSDGRKWQNGLHQAVEVKEGLPPSEAAGTAAQITVASYFRRYTHLAGLTGTALEARREFRRIYGLRVVAIDTVRPCRRRELPPRIFVSQAAKHRHIVRVVRERVAAGGAVLIGTPSVAASRALSIVLADSGIEHEVLNCHAHRRESEIIGRAGSAGRVTVATNMAGRGADIRVDEQAIRAGGLFVIATELHASRRTDRQLIGRTARQGDPGQYQFCLSLNDELFARAPHFPMGRLAQADANMEGELPVRCLALFRAAQRALERQHERQRRSLFREDREHVRRCRAAGLNPVLEVVTP
jgi:preprotein translocase subunit SecA